MKYKPKHKTPKDLLLCTGFKNTDWGWIKTRQKFLEEGVIKKKYGKVFRVHCFITSEGKLYCHCDKYRKKTMAVEYTGGLHDTEHTHFLLTEVKRQFISKDV